MGRLYFCSNGLPLNDQVMIYQDSRVSDDYLPIQSYYNEYKEQWFNQLEDYMDRETFDSEFDFRLSRAVDKFSEYRSKHLACRNGWTDLGRFNRWFFRILSNWKSNVKTSSFRLKKRPSTQCPICGRFVGRIEQVHLEHFKGLSDLPKHFVWKGEIFETTSVPRVNAVSWGKKTLPKWRSLQKSESKSYIKDKHRVDWPWFLKDGEKGVVCPFTKKIIPQITEMYIRTLPDKYSRYADPTKWADFVETYPSSIIQSEVYSLEHSIREGRSNEKAILRDRVASDSRISESMESLDYEMICAGKVPFRYENTFRTIDILVKSAIERDILKLIAAGYVIEDISDTLEIDRKEIRRRMRLIRDNIKDLESMLID